MDRLTAEILDRYEQRALQERQMMQGMSPVDIASRLDEFLLSVGPEAGNFLHSLAIARGAKRIVELGTSYGYSTVFLADAARRTGGRVSSFELHDKKQRYAREQLAQANLADFVDWRLGDAVAMLDEEDDGIDFVLIDLWKDLYVPCLEKLYPKLADNALIVADNMLYPAAARESAIAYRAAVRAKPGIESMLLPIGEGLELSCLWRNEMK